MLLIFRLFRSKFQGRGQNSRGEGANCFRGRPLLKKARTVSIIYSLCYGLSQRTNHLQKDFTSQLRLTGASERSISTARNLGLTTASGTGLRDAAHNSGNNHAKVNAATSEALERGTLLCA